MLRNPYSGPLAAWIAPTRRLKVEAASTTLSLVAQDAPRRRHELPIVGALILSTALAGAAEPGREELLAAGEHALAQGDAPQAALLFQQAGFVKHAADAEIGLTRAYMQAGEYRRTLAFAAHTAGAHPDSSAGGALYAQLLDLSDQTALAARLLKQPAARLAPYSPGSDALPKGAHAVSGGVLLAGGRAALAAAAPLKGAERLWVRNGLGAVSPARVARRMDDLGLALLELDAPLGGEALPAAPRDAFPGSPAYAVGYAASDDAAPAWPLLRVGFIGRRNLGIALPPGPRGGPVLDAAGRVVGLALGDGAGVDRLVPASALKAWLEPTAGTELQVGEIYERALRATLQVIAAR
jgi:hypothetical protein